METVSIGSNTYTLQIPSADKSFFMALVKKMGWTAKCQKRNETMPAATLKAIKEARSGKDAGIVNMDSLEGFLKSME